jgi:hypothetical protein
MLSSKQRRDWSLLIGIINSVLRFKAIKEPTKPDMIKIFRQDNILIGIVPDICEIQFIRKKATLVLVNFNVVLLFLIEIKNGAVEIFVMELAGGIRIWWLT